jgi:hypothetical protein
VLFAILALSYLAIGRIQPLPKGDCPHNAECGVFVHCNQGYVLEGNRCVIDPELTLQARKICTAVVEQLKVSYGNADCQRSDIAIPTKRIREVLEEFEVFDSLLKEEIYDYFDNPLNQESQGFSVSANILIPR